MFWVMTESGEMFRAQFLKAVTHKFTMEIGVVVKVVVVMNFKWQCLQSLPWFSEWSSASSLIGLIFWFLGCTPDLKDTLYSHDWHPMTFWFFPKSYKKPGFSRWKTLNENRQNPYKVWIPALTWSKEKTWTSVWRGEGST